MPTHRDPVDVATKLAKFVKQNNLDECDIDYEEKLYRREKLKDDL